VVTCPWCPGGCAGADLTGLLVPDLAWLWSQLAAAGTRRGDPHLVTGHVQVTCPPGARERAAAAGLLGGRPLPASGRRRVDLAALTAALAPTGPGVTPGVVAAHATGTRLSARAQARAHADRTREQLRSMLTDAAATLPEHLGVDGPTLWERARSTGWVTRLLADPDPQALLGAAIGVLGRLPGPTGRVDRRTLVPGGPHDLDHGRPLASLVLALAGRPASRPRPAWASLGVVLDDLTGGLLTLNVTPTGWVLPAGTTVTIPPRELARARWAPPPAGEPAWVFVVENPSVVAAAADACARARVVCTVGTPSRTELDAIAAVAAAGWSVAVRADFDAAGFAHVRDLLTACPTAVPWRMDAGTYTAHAAGAGTTDPVRVQAGPQQTPWDPALGAAVRRAGVAVYEEDVLPGLLEDLASGAPAR